jgi:hypothetical protein
VNPAVDQGAAVRNRWLTVFFQAAPIVFLLFLFRDGLKCWFIADDFAWLGLLRQVYSPHDLLRALFEPAAQGTIRPWSDRGFFLLFEYLFGVDDLPFRIMAFATMSANLLLVNWVTRRITHSPLAGFIAAICWAANTALMVVMTWSSAYDEALCPLFLLSALALFIRFSETGKRKFWWWQLVVFSLGFGALEINVVYPALAAAYASFVAPREKRRALLVGLWPLFAISVAYFFWHRAVAPLPSTGPYLVRIDWRVFRALLMYGKWSLLPVDWTAFGHSAVAGKSILWIGIAGIVALLISEAIRRRTTVWFFIVWYLASLAPVLVLPEHHSDYYLTIPLIGLAMLFAFGVTCGTRDAGKWRWLALIPVIAYLFGMIPISQSATHWSFDKTQTVRALVLGTDAARAKHPDKTILLKGITRGLYDDSMGQGAFAPLGIDNVYLTPESAPDIGGGENVADLETTVLDPDATVHAIKKDQVVIYSVAGDHLRNVTEGYELSAPSSSSDRLPSRIDVGNPLYSWLLGQGWLPPESGIRWMPGRATVHLRGPDSAGSKLELDGFFPAEQLKRVPRVLKVSVDGIPVGSIQIHDPESSFRRLFYLQPSVVGKDSIEIELEASPVDTRGGQEYGMVFGKIAIRPRGQY